MQFFVILTLFASVFLSAVNGAPVLERRAARSFAALTISGANTVGGNALAEAQAKFPGNPATLSAATSADFNADAHCAVLAEAAFLAQGAIASSNRATNAISVGLFKNKVLKIFGTQVALQAQIAAQGGKASASQQAQLDDLATKLAANVAVDKTNAGLASATVDFTC
ncbi:hypothetical protein C8J56DRAFT_1013506 [Mycena floridula]|nr:hypothetical protein C8J56DRAFT_1013506 [Mycena floridula]